MSVVAEAGLLDRLLAAVGPAKSPGATPPPTAAPLPDNGCPQVLAALVSNPSPILRRTSEQWPLPAGWMHHKVYGAQHTDTVVLIHGLTGDLRTYDTVAKSLSQYYRVVTVDLRGHGETPAYGWNYSSALLARDVKGLLDELNGRWGNKCERVHIVGHSFGGKVALRFTELFPDSVRSLVIEDMHFLPAEASAQEANVERGWRNAVAKVQTKLPHSGLSLDPELSGPSQVDIWRGLSDKEFVVSLFGTQVRGENFENALAKLRAPALFLRPTRGENGAMSDRGVLHVQSRVRHAKIVEFEGSGHDIHNARTDDYLRAVGTFIAENLGR